jgi:hypothetical protein
VAFALRVLVLAALYLVAAGAAQPDPVSEPAVKAAFLYKFLGYVEWPGAAANPDGEYVIATAGADDVAGELERIAAGRSMNGRRIAVRRVREGESLRGVSILFLGRGFAGARDMLRASQSKPLLTVTEVEQGLDLGSVVNLVTLEDRVGFEVSMGAAERNGLAISSRMLAVARRIVPRASP